RSPSYKTSAGFLAHDFECLTLQGGEWAPTKPGVPRAWASRGMTACDKVRNRPHRWDAMRHGTGRRIERACPWWVERLERTFKSSKVGVRLGGGLGSGAAWAGQLVQRAADAPQLAQGLEDVAGVGHLGAAAKARGALDLGGGDALVETARLDGDL